MPPTSASDPFLEAVSSSQWKLVISLVVTIFLGGWATLAAVQVTAKSTVENSVESLSQTIKANEVYSRNVVDRLDAHIENEKLYREAEQRERNDLRNDLRDLRNDLRALLTPVITSKKNNP